ncbi:hypothetical protein [Hoeflea sp.]|uniref:hypothetical protein n=1 Tax=Hoeflea sp. TaxID=1940281 RepID=UPI003B029631
MKMHFLTVAEIDSMKSLSFRKKYQIGLKGYERFKAWEKENPTLVDQIRRQLPAGASPGS